MSKPLGIHCPHMIENIMKMCQSEWAKEAFAPPSLALTKPTLSEVRMAIDRICSIPNCGKRPLARGWCKAHYRRWQRHGDPLSGGTLQGEPLAYFREVVLAYEGDECLTWPYAHSKGYGKLIYGGQTQFIHRAVCEHVNGPPPTPDHEAAHSCGKGHLGCCTKSHLSWKTHAENMADTIVHGTNRARSAKLTESDVREILALRGKKLHREIAEQFGVGQTTIGMILRGKNWGWIEEGSSL